MSVEAGRKDPEGDRLLLLEWNNIEDITCSLIGFLVTKLSSVAHSINIEFEFTKFLVNSEYFYSDGFIKDLIISEKKVVLES